MLSVIAGGLGMGLLFNLIGGSPLMDFPAWQHLLMGGFLFGTVFMATDPVSAAHTKSGKIVYGIFIGMMAMVIRVVNKGYPEGMMLAILLGNIFAPLIDYCVVQLHISKRKKVILRPITLKTDCHMKFSNRYIFIFITIIVVICAAILTFASVGLQHFQKANREKERMSQILQASSYFDVKEVIAFYKTVAVDTTIKGAKGEDLPIIKIKSKSGGVLLCS